MIKEQSKTNAVSPDGPAMSIDMERRQTFQTAILEWHATHGRMYPWRQTDDPYLIFVAEILLQQTRAAQALPAYEMITSRWPTARDMASCDPAELHSIIDPLGFSKRVDFLIRSCADVMEKHDGLFPRTRQDLEALHGVGYYAASSILCFAFGERCAIIDTNVIRVYTRAFGMSGDPARRPGQDYIKFAEEMLPAGREQEYNHALLDLGALVCKAGHPICDECPIQTSCRTFEKMNAAPAHRDS